MKLAETSRPWSTSDVRSAFVATVGGAAVLAWAWWQASSTSNTHHARELDALQGAGMHDHASFTAAGVLAVFVIGAGSLMWVLSGHMAVRRRRRALLARLQSAPRRGAAHAAPVGSATLVTVDGSTRYHRPSCVLVEGRAQRPVKGNGSRSGRLRRCEMCEL